MNAPPRLVLKQSSGWFAAGWQFAEALLSLSDAAFKLFAWLCLNADRYTGQIRLPVPEISQALVKPEPWTQAALKELHECGVCRWTAAELVEVTDSYWPYEKQPSEAGPQEYVAQVRKILLAPACVHCRFTPADEKLARDLQRRGVSLAQIQRAIWLGCARKYTTLLRNDAASIPISSLSYFMAVIEEVCQNKTADSYWAYVRRIVGEMEREWLSRTRNSTSQSGT
jgi:hypothetical protein